MVELDTEDAKSPAGLRIHAILSQSEVNGPGPRLVIWTQGCGKACPGCFNPETWTARGGSIWEPMALARYVQERARTEEIKGLTLTGGDPLEQASAVRDFLQALHEYDSQIAFLPGGIICFTGYTLEEIESLHGAEGDAARDAIQYLDLLIDGRYIQTQKIVDRLAGSSNQRFHFSSTPGRGRVRIGASEITVDQGVEIHVTEEPDTFELTGFPSVNRSWLKSKGVRIIAK